MFGNVEDEGASEPGLTPAAMKVPRQGFFRWAGHAGMQRGRHTIGSVPGAEEREGVRQGGVGAEDRPVLALRHLGHGCTAGGGRSSIPSAAHSFHFSPPHRPPPAGRAQSWPTATCTLRAH